MSHYLIIGITRFDDDARANSTIIFIARWRYAFFFHGFDGYRDVAENSFGSGTYDYEFKFSYVKMSNLLDPRLNLAYTLCFDYYSIGDFFDARDISFINYSYDTWRMAEVTFGSRVDWSFD